ncbi:hypothetical protein MMC30_002967 [Trapelia coarctata]|nr:hypothetical protein [Trapelia coarctata]
MPSRIERLTIKWLLRVALLGTISFAVWGSLSSWYHPQKARLQQATQPVEDATNEMLQYAEATNTPIQGKERGNALVVVSLKSEDTSWLGGLLEEWERNIYVVDGEALKEGAQLRIPKNKGREGMVYLSFIIDNYDNLPNVTLFLHSARYQWHNDDPLYDGIPILQNLRIDYIKTEGYANLRCGWTLGCPSEIQPERKIDDERTETYYSDAFKILFPNEPVPGVVGICRY